MLWSREFNLLCIKMVKIFKVSLTILGRYISKNEKTDTDDMIKLISKYRNKASYLGLIGDKQSGEKFI